MATFTNGCLFFDLKERKNLIDNLDNKRTEIDSRYEGAPRTPLGDLGILPVTYFYKDDLQDIEEIDIKRKFSKSKVEEIITKYVKGVRGVDKLDKSDTCWFGTPFICEADGLKNKLVAYLESNKIQTRNYFAGNILMHPGYSFLDDYKKYPEANKVLDKVFFIGAAPHYTEPVFKYIEDVIKKFK